MSVTRKSANLDFSELHDYIERFEGARKDYPRFVKEFLQENADDIWARARENTPVDTGALKAGFALSEIRGFGTEVEIDIYNDQEYASFVEYGRITSLGNKVEGRLMLTVAVDQVWYLLPKRYEEAFAEWAKNWGLGD